MKHLLTTTKLTLATTALAILSVVAAAGFSPSQPVQAQAAIQDCSDNSIIKCGASSPADLVNKIRANNPADLQAIYTKFNLSPSQYDTFASEAKMGVAKQNGEIVVDGKVVATDSWSIGRQKFSYSTDYSIGNNKYYKSASTKVLKQDLPVMVWLNGQGKVQTAVLAACGNPMGGATVAPASAPSYKCSSIRKEAVSGQANTYRFTTSATASSGAKVSRVVYSFGDGTAEVTAGSLTEPVTHTFATAGTYTAKATVYVLLPNGQEVAANGSGCTTSITVAEPRQEVKKQAAWQCTALRAVRQSTRNEDRSYTFEAATTSTNATLSRADFDYGDGTSSKGVAVAGSSSTSISSTHTYASPGTYTAKATVYFEPAAGSNAEGKDSSSTCEVTVTVSQPVTPAATPTAPVAPAVLPNAGPAGLLGLFTGASALGTLGYRWRANRRVAKVDELVNKLRNS